MCVGAIEEILMDDDFIDHQNSFCKKHCDKFEDTDENKLIYTALFEEYTVFMENTLNNILTQKIPVNTYNYLLFHYNLILKNNINICDLF